MTEATVRPQHDEATTVSWSVPSAYEQWVESIGVPIHRGFYVPDLRTVELGPWDERECNAAFLLLAGQEGVSEARVTEVPPGATLPPLTMAVDEVVYVVEGRGLTTVWTDDAGPRRTFEWQKHSMFCIPRFHRYQLGNAHGSAPARLLHCNYLPLTLQAIPDPSYFVNVSGAGRAGLDGPDATLFSEAKAIEQTEAGSGPRGGVFWFGNFFPNMRAWDHVVPFKGRGAGGHVVWVRFPDSPVTAHMSVFPSRTYKKAHRHGPGFVIVIPAGEGFSVMWPEGQEKVVIPWQEASVFVPPNRWFHQHFNLGPAPARYLALHPPRALSGTGERVQDPQRDTIQYPDEEPWIRAKFEEELSKRGLTSQMPEEAYRDRDYEWDYGGGS
ncbi:MAG TPA: cupin domain-containing protein [Chloroflexota bacterium]|nr:cupin domain-containing protein [Chloroflexota bacterium]